MIVIIVFMIIIVIAINTIRLIDGISIYIVIVSPAFVLLPLSLLFVSIVYILVTLPFITILIILLGSIVLSLSRLLGLGLLQPLGVKRRRLLGGLLVRRKQTVHENETDNLVHN